MRFMDIRKRIYKFPKMGVKAELVCITTTSGTGSEVTPFAVVTDDATGMKYPLADYELTPNMAIVDANLVMGMPKSLCAFGGIDAVTHIGHVGHIAVGIDAGSLVSGQALFQAALVGAVEADGSAALCHALGNGEADAVCAAGDQGNLALQIKCSKIHK